MKLLYDVKRLISRSLALSPRGIDRVDIRYAYYCLTEHVTIFVYSQSGIFYALDAFNASEVVEINDVGVQISAHKFAGTLFGSLSPVQATVALNEWQQE